MSGRNVTAAELAHRTRRHGVRIDERLAREFLEHWRERGIAEQHHGGWRLTCRGQAMFSSWASELEPEAEELI